MRHLLLALLLACAGPLTLRAQGRPAHAYVMDQWTTETGLPQNSVNGIAQTPDGYLWLATYGGLVRFDGVTFTSFPAAAHPGIRSDRDLRLCVAPDSALWIGTDDGLTEYRRGRFRTWGVGDGVPAGEIVSVSCGRDGVVWAAMNQQGIVRWERGRIRRLPVDSTVNAGIFLAVPDGSGGAWLGVWGHPASHLERGAAIVTRDEDGLPAPDLDSPMPAEPDGSVWWRSRRGLLRSDPAGGRLELLPAPRRGFVGFASRSPDGGAWLGTSAGLALERPDGTLDWYALPGGGRDYRVKSVFVDREGVTWVGTDTDGLLRLRRRVFTTITRADGLASDLPMGITGDARGRVYVGSNCSGLSVIEGGRIRVYDGARAPRAIRGCDWSVAVAPNGAVWIGTYGGGIQEWRNGRVREFTRADGVRDMADLAVYAARNGDVWSGTLTGGVIRIRAGKVAVFDTAQGLPDNDVLYVTETGAGALWVGTRGGAARFDGRRFIPLTAREGLARGAIRAICGTADGALWFGSYGGGLSRLKNGRVVTITSADGLFENVVSSITEDSQGFFWTTGNRGIARVRIGELEAFADGRIRSVHAESYGAADGLLNAETNGGFEPAAWRARDGRIWFPTLHGVAIVDPAGLARTGRAPGVVIEGVTADGRDAGATGPLRLDPGTRDIAIHYTGLSSVAPERITFRYRLAADEPWTDVGTRRTAFFTRLPPGAYQFQVTAAGRDGLWNLAGARLDFRVLPPYWATWWFRLLVLAAVALAGAAAIGLRTRRLRVAHAAQREFSRRLIDGQELERRRIAAELHDSVGQGLLVMKNRAELGLRSAGGDAIREQLEQISAMASETLKETRAIAHNLRPYQLDRLGLAAAVRAAVEGAAEGSGIRFGTEIGPVDGLLEPDAETSLFRIVQEGLSNVLKHSGAAAAMITLAAHDGVVRLTITDDGRGADAASGFGTSVIAQRVALLGGSYELRTATGAGATLVVTLPARNAGSG